MLKEHSGGSSAVLVLMVCYDYFLYRLCLVHQGSKLRRRLEGMEKRATLNNQKEVFFIKE